MHEQTEEIRNTPIQHRVMVVDDDGDVLYTVAKILEMAQFPVIKAKGGKECLRHLENGFQGLILMDVMMPEMNGWQTVNAIMQGGYADRNLICRLTAKDDLDPVMNELKEHIIHFLKKPFSSQEIVAVVKEYLQYMDHKGKKNA